MLACKICFYKAMIVILKNSPDNFFKKLSVEKITGVNRFAVFIKTDPAGILISEITAGNQKQA